MSKTVSPNQLPEGWKVPKSNIRQAGLPFITTTARLTTGHKLNFMKYLFFFLPLSAFAQVEPFAGIDAGVNFGTGLHAGAEAGVSFNRRFIAAVDYTAYFGVWNKHAAGVKVGVATIYNDTDGLCPVYLIAGASQGHYRGADGKPYQSITPTFAVRVQTYNGYWEAGRQNGFWSFTVGYQFRRIYQ